MGAGTVLDCLFTFSTSGIDAAPTADSRLEHNIHHLVNDIVLTIPSSQVAIQDTRRKSNECEDSKLNAQTD